MNDPALRRLPIGVSILFAAFLLLVPHSAASSEAEDAAALLGLEPGMTVAEIGAGDGAYTIGFARKVGASGRVFATELEPETRAEIARRATAAGLANVELFEAKQVSTGLPADCCSAAFMRHVYHHLTDPAAINRDLLRALRPGGLLVIVDFPPTWYLVPFAPEGVGDERTSHGIEIDAALRELETAGFERVRVIPDWHTHWFGPDGYALVLRKPSADRAR